MVDGLPLVSAALGALLPDVELWPVGIEGVGSEMVVRYAVIPRQVVELLGGGGSSAPVAGVHGLVVDRGRLAAMGVGVVGVARVPNVVLVREDVAQRLWESGASGVEFTAPEAFVMQFGALSPGEHARLEALLAEARSAAVRVAAEVEVGAAVAGQIEGGQIGGRSLEVWVGEAWAYRGVPHFASVGLDPGEFVDEVVAAWREALAEALARRAG